MSSQETGESSNSSRNGNKQLSSANLRVPATYPKGATCPHCSHLYSRHSKRRCDKCGAMNNVCLVVGCPCSDKCLCHIPPNPPSEEDDNRAQSNKTTHPEREGTEQTGGRSARRAIRAAFKRGHRGEKST